MLKTTLPVLASLALVAGAGCNLEQSNIFIQGVIPIEPPDCVAKGGGGVFDPEGLLDLGAAGGNVNSLTVALDVVTNLPSTFSTQDLSKSEQRSPNYPFYGNTDSNIVNFKRATVELASETQTALTNNGTPGGGGAPRESAVSGAVFNVQTSLGSSGVAFLTAISEDDARSLLEEKLVLDADLTEPTNSVRIVANLRVIGVTSGGTEVQTPTFGFPVKLCAGGCLAGPVCPPGQVLTPTSCFVGTDSAPVCK